MTKGICGNWAGTLNMSWTVGTKGGTKMMIVMASASVMCG
jgi:hypothetical protein